MAEKGFKRKLTAILSADVEGYSRLMGQDEEATVRTLTAYREVLTTLIHQHNGKVLDSPGDNLLAEFASVVDAVQCAVAVQKEIKARNEELPENRRMQFRIGINLGDVIQEEDRIYGDGVNIAARLEGLAEPGGICISKTAFDHIESKLPYGYEFLGDQEVKNIAKPVGAYRVLMEPRVTVAEMPPEKPAPVRRMPIIIGAIAILVIAIFLAIWQFYIRRPSIEAASVEKMAFNLPDKPSIAVLPFDNLSGDPEQEYFCDGMTEDLITDLSKISGIFVIARNSTFIYKGKPIKIKQVAEELGVRYVLEGSVRKAEDKVRINAQLIDAINGHHLWAERYTGKIGDVFSLQDKITQDIVSSLAVKLTGGEQYSLIQKETNSIEAYDNFLKGWAHYLRFTPKDIEDAFYFFFNATALDPNYGQAWAAYTACLQKVAEVRGTIQETLIYSGWEELRTETREGVIKAMENPSALAYQVAAEIESKQRLHEAAIEYAKQAVSIEPNNASFLAVLGKLLIFAGKPNEAVSFIRKAERHDPYNQSHYLFLHGLINFRNGQLDEAMILFERAIANNPEFYLWRAVLAATYALANRIQSAQSEMDKFKKMSYWTPTLEFVMFFFPFEDFTTADRLANGLIKAGLRKGHLGYYSASNESRLSGEKIRQLTFGQTIEGVDPLTGVPYKIDIGKDGKAAYRKKYYFTSFSGKSWIENEKLCYQWSGLFHSYKYCSPVFRNIKPSSDTADDYLLATDWGICPFSLVD